MQDLLNLKTNKEINLHDLFMNFWTYKLLIASTCAMGIVLGGYHVLNADKKFTSEAIFKLEQAIETPRINNNLDLLSSLAAVGQNANTLPKDLIMGRVFIENLDPTLNFKADPYFNTYNPNSVDPVWKSTIKRAIGWQMSPTNDEEAIWQSIVKKFSKHVVLDETKDGSAKIIVTHVIPQRAADIANTIMNKIISITEIKKVTNKNMLLTYLSNNLAKALSDLEASQSNLNKFTLKNSAQPLESFVAGSLELNALREELSQTTELHEAVAALLIILKNKTTDQDNYLILRQEFPIVDQVEFRRVLGQNEIINSWSWPEASTVDTVFDTLSERKSRLQSQINASQIDAERSNITAEAYSKLHREAKISEATYTVLIEQVKAQSISAGYQPNKSEIYEYASISTTPSAPNQSLILALGAILGLFVGMVLSLLLAFRRGVFHSKRSLMIAVQARFTESFRSILPLRHKSLKDLNSVLIKKPRTLLRDLAVEIHKSGTTQVVVTSSRTKLTSNDMARALSTYIQSDSLKVAVIDFSSKAKKLDIATERLSVGSFVVAESLGNVLILRPDDNLMVMELLSQRDFTKNIQSLYSTIDILFLCADNGDAKSLLSALEKQKAFHITLARINKTKSSALMHMRSLLPIQGLLYD
jgi:uncharacterized protein involved in exopolysaccharide biosynthesis